MEEVSPTCQVPPTTDSKKWASSQSESCHSDESHEIMPMDPRRDLYYGASAPGGDSADSCSRSGSEFYWKSGGRSSADLEGMCGPQQLEENLGMEATLDGAKLKALGDNYLCQWNCEDPSALVVYLESSKSDYSCKDDPELKGDESSHLEVIQLQKGDTESDCLTSCDASECKDKCVKNCARIKSASLNSGGAKCSANVTAVLEKTEYDFEKGLTPGAIILIIAVVLCQCCCCVCPQMCKGRHKTEDW